MKRPLLLLAALCALSLATPAAAQASRSQFTLFEAPRELRSSDPRVRDRTFDEIESFGVHWIRVVLYGTVTPGRGPACCDCAATDHQRRGRHGRRPRAS